MVPTSAVPAEVVGDDGLDERTLKEHEAATKVKNIASVVLGAWQMDAWYFSPYPLVPEGVWCSELYVCEHCLQPHTSLDSLHAHEARCTARHPPGDEIYRDGALSVFEVDGALAPGYCRRLCLLSKLFLDHKVLLQPVSSFAFYVLTRWQPCGACTVVGYFSKDTAAQNTLACLLVLPPHQRKGYGALLIGLSYELARREGQPGTPERPLSDLGLATYRAFWASALLHLLADRARKGEPISVRELVSRTAICEADVLSTLQSLRLLRYAGGAHSLCLTPLLLARYAPNAPAEGSEQAQREASAGARAVPRTTFTLVVDPSKLIWQPRKPTDAAAPLAVPAQAAAPAQAVAPASVPAAANSHGHKRARAAVPATLAASSSGAGDAPSDVMPVRRRTLRSDDVLKAA